MNICSKMSDITVLFFTILLWVWLIIHSKLLVHTLIQGRPLFHAKSSWVNQWAETSKPLKELRGIIILISEGWCFSSMEFSTAGIVGFVVKSAGFGEGRLAEGCSVGWTTFQRFWHAKVLYYNIKTDLSS